MNKLSTIAIIPARGGSKGLPRKNIRLLDGIPLIAHTINAARNSNVIEHIVVSTDDAEIAEAARSFGAEVPFLRPKEFAEDQTTMENTLRQALLAYEQHIRLRFDIAVFLAPTDVFRKPEWIRDAVEILEARPDIESAFSAQVSFKNFWEELPEGGYQRVRTYMQVYGQRQERIRNKRVIYREDTGLACASRAHLWRTGRRIGDKVEIIPTRDSAVDIDIHTEFDLYMAEQALQWRKKNQ